MKIADGNSRRVQVAPRHSPGFIYHPTFEDADASSHYGGLPDASNGESVGHMPDPTTCDYARRMHYAGWRVSTATTTREAARWRRAHLRCRDLILLGNRKLVYRAVHKWSSFSQCADDMVSECNIVLIKAVAAFNPWKGIRFSTYAFTCLLRALSRLSQRQASDRLSQWLPLESLSQGEPADQDSDASTKMDVSMLEKYLRDEHTLLTPREKIVLIRRYHLHDAGSQTLTFEQVGRDLGLSKQRVRQVQMSALDKLRKVLAPESM